MFPDEVCAPSLLLLPGASHMRLWSSHKLYFWLLHGLADPGFGTHQLNPAGVAACDACAQIDTPREVDARVRFAKYRGVRSWRSSEWDPKEGLPPGLRPRVCASKTPPARRSGAARGPPKSLSVARCLPTCRLDALVGVWQAPLLGIVQHSVSQASLYAANDFAKAVIGLLCSAQASSRLVCSYRSALVSALCSFCGCRPTHADRSRATMNHLQGGWLTRPERAGHSLRTGWLAQGKGCCGGGGRPAGRPWRAELGSYVHRPHRPRPLRSPPPQSRGEACPPFCRHCSIFASSAQIWHLDARCHADAMARWQGLYDARTEPSQWLRRILIALRKRDFFTHAWIHKHIAVQSFIGGHCLKPWGFLARWSTGRGWRRWRCSACCSTRPSCPC